jgi:hypothetical protein
MDPLDRGDKGIHNVIRMTYLGLLRLLIIVYIYLVLVRWLENMFPVLPFVKKLFYD